MPHIHEKIDFGVETFIVHRGKVFLRKHDKYGIWLTAGGHVELDEDPNEAAVREAKEEAGLDIVLRGDRPEFVSDDPSFDSRSLVPPRYMQRHHTEPTHEHIVFIYFASTKSDHVAPQADGDRSDEWRWFTEEELRDSKWHIRPDIQLYATEALKAAIMEQWQ